MRQTIEEELCEQDAVLGMYEGELVCFTGTGTPPSTPLGAILFMSDVVYTLNKLLGKETPKCWVVPEEKLEVSCAKVLR